MKHLTQWKLAAAVLVAVSVPAMAGQLVLVLGNPEANEQAKAAGAVLTFKVAGCGEPAKAEVSAVAIGEVDGKRQSVPLNLTKLDEPGAYAVTRQWPANGNWVLQFTAKDGPRVASTLVPAGITGIERGKAVMTTKAATDADVAGLLAKAHTH